MTREEFIKKCVLRGYGYAHQLRQWCREYPRDAYTEEDMITAYTWCNRYPNPNEARMEDENE